MNSAYFTSNAVVEVLRQATLNLVAAPSDVDEALGDRIIPRDLRQWLARLRLLENVPFAYLVPDSLLLPPESIRFFYVDRNWTDALVQGALSVGTVNSSDRAQLEQLHRQIRDELDEEERALRTPARREDPEGPGRHHHRTPAALPRRFRLARHTRARLPQGSRTRHADPARVPPGPHQAPAPGTSRSRRHARLV